MKVGLEWEVATLPGWVTPAQPANPPVPMWVERRLFLATAGEAAWGTRQEACDLARQRCTRHPGCDGATLPGGGQLEQRPPSGAGTLTPQVLARGSVATWSPQSPSGYMGHAEGNGVLDAQRSVQAERRSPCLFIPHTVPADRTGWPCPAGEGGSGRATRFLWTFCDTQCRRLTLGPEARPQQLQCSVVQ